MQIRLAVAAVLWSGVTALLAAVKPSQPVVEKPFPPVEAARTMQVPKGVQRDALCGEPASRSRLGFALMIAGGCGWRRRRIIRTRRRAERSHYHSRGTDGDGRHDKRIVFYDKLEYVSGIEVGFGGVWVMSLPNFYFIPDEDYDGVPDGKPKVLLDGFGTTPTRTISPTVSRGGRTVGCTLRTGAPTGHWWANRAPRRLSAGVLMAACGGIIRCSIAGRFLLMARPIRGALTGMTTARRLSATA